MADVKEILVQWDAGEGVSVIAQTLGYSRPTVRKYVRAAGLAGMARDGQRRREAGWEELSRTVVEQVAAVRQPGEAGEDVARFHDYVAQRIDEVRMTVLYQRLHDEQGLTASWGTFYRYVRRHWPEAGRHATRVTVRLPETPAGDEAEVDFFYAGRWHDPEEQRERRLYAFLMTLGHSRHEFLYPVLGEDARSFLEGHSAGFTFFKGAPRRIVPDNLTAGILRPDLYDPRSNRAYGELARYYGCVIDPSRVRRPQDKAKVERNVDYARASFFRGRTFVSLKEMREAARTWCLDVAGRRVHGTTGERPLEAFLAREQPALLPLPARPWEFATWTTAKVHADCHLQASGARYSVPHRFVGKRLDVRLGETMVTIYEGADLVTSHVRRERGRSTRLDHYPDAAQAFLRFTPQVCLESATAMGPAVGRLVRERLEVHALHNLREAQAIVRLAQRYDRTRLDHACQRALDAGDGRYRTVRGILERGLDLIAPEEAAPSVATGAYLRGPDAFAGQEAH